MNSTPMFRSVNCIRVRTPKISISGPNGMTAIEVSASVMARNGANR